MNFTLYIFDGGSQSPKKPKKAMRKCYLPHLACWFLLSALTTTTGTSATVGWAAAQDNGFGLADGTDLAAGSLLRLGTFTNLSDAQIVANKADLNFLDSYFVEFASSAIGVGVGGLDAHFAQSDTVNAGSLGLIGDQIFFWAFDAATLGGASQHGIFYLNSATNSAWAFPTDTPGSDDTTIDISQLTSVDALSLIGGATILAGGFGVGTSDFFESPAGGSVSYPLFNLEVIPEPSTYALIAMGLGLIGLRFRRRK